MRQAILLAALLATAPAFAGGHTNSTKDVKTTPKGNPLISHQIAAPKPTPLISHQ